MFLICKGPIKTFVIGLC